MKRGLTLGLSIVVAWFVLPSGGGTRSLLLRAQKPGEDLKIVYVAGIGAGGNALKSGDSGLFSSMYVVTGAGGGHTLALGMDDGILLVDTKAPGWGKRLMEKVHLTTDDPVTVIINSNPGGAANNSAFPDVASIYAHENTKVRLAAMDAFKGSNAKFLPNKTFKDNKLSVPLKTVGAGGTNRVDMYHFGKGYTDGDLVVVFPSFSVAYFGELFPDKMVPTIDVANGGSAVALPDTLARAAAELKTAGIQTVVPAHTPPPFKVVLRWVTMQDFAEYTEFTRELLGATKAAMTAGKSVDEAVAGLQLPAKFKSYGMQNARAYVEAVYNELKAKK